MTLINKDNVLAAKRLYRQRLKFLQTEVQRVTTQGLALGIEHEDETMAKLDVIEEELAGVAECLTVLNHLLTRS